MKILDEPEWVVLHGDSAESPVWAVLDDNGNTLDLTGWWVSAQARDTVDDPTPQYTWLVGEGIDIGTAVVETKTDRHVNTSTVSLYLRPADYAQLPRAYSGVVDVEIATDNGPEPDERHTIVRFPFRIEPDVTRAGV